MSNNMKDLMTDKVHFEICQIGRDQIDKFENGRLVIFVLVAFVCLKLFDKGVECMAEYMEQKQ